MLPAPNKRSTAKRIRKDKASAAQVPWREEGIMAILQKRFVRTAACFAVAAIAMLGACQAAFADDAESVLRVSGADYYGNGAVDASQSTEVEALHVEGAGTETVYLKVQQNGNTIADRISFNLSENAQDNALGNRRVGVVKLDIEGFDLAKNTYTVSAYADRSESDALFTGTIYGVYAKFPDGSQKLIGTHVSSTKSVGSYKPSASLYIDGKTYAYDEKGADFSGSHMVYGYEEYSEADCSTGTINYVAADGTVLATKTVAGIPVGGSKTAKIPHVVTGTGEDGTTQLYRTVTSLTEVTFTNPGQMTYNIQCRWIGSSKDIGTGSDKHYVATINMVDEDGNAIITDTVSVTGTFKYTLPSTIYKKVGKVVYTYKLASGSDSVLTFKTTDTDVVDHAKTVEVKYTGTAGTPSSTAVHFNYIDGTNQDASDSNRSLGSKDVVVTADNKTATPDETVTVNGTTYKIAGTAAKYAYTFGDSTYPTINVYYVPEGYEPSNGSYEVTVNYVNFLTKETIKSETFTSSESDASDYQFTSAKKFSQDGTDYIRLDGQEDGISHSYYSGTKTYTVYYRDKNDTYTSGTVINKVRVVYEPGTNTTVTVDGGSTTSGTTGSGGADDSDDNATTGALNDDGTYNVLDGDNNNSTLTNEEGVDSNTERIDDTETPLASGAQDEGQAVPAWAIPLGILAALAAIGGVVFFIMKRRNNNEQNA